MLKRILDRLILIDIKEKNIGRVFYKASCVFILALMICISGDFGITGDEMIQRNHGDLSLKFYTSLGKDTSYKNPPHVLPGWENQKYYGSVFDVVCSIFSNPTNAFETRHLINAISGFIGILFCSFIALELSGVTGGIIALWFLTLTPFFFGHSFNNPKDLPFASFYIVSVYYLILFVKEFPSPTKRTIILLSVSIGICFAIRVGGLLLYPYLALFSFIASFNHIYNRNTTLSRQLKKKKTKNKSDINFKALSVIIKKVLLVCLVSYGVGVILWPYAIENPILNPFRALKFASNSPISVNVLFEGDNTMSNELPWYFLPKSMLMTCPEVIWLGLFLLPFAIKNKTIKLPIFILLFTSLFPLAYILYKHASVHGSWRHVMFVYTPIVAASAVGWDGLIKKMNNSKIKYFIYLLLGVLLLHPALFMIKNHPNEYVYFNFTSGGIKKAYGKYETDYYFNSLKEASNWFKKNVPSNASKKTVIFSTGANYLKEYFKSDTNYQAKYVRYYERYYQDWDYAILTSVYVNSYQITNKIWPFKNTIYKVEADGVPLCVVIKRENKDDFHGFTELNKKNYVEAKEYFKKAIAYDAQNEGAWMGLGEAYMNLNELDNAEKASYQALQLYPEFIPALLSYGMVKSKMNKLQDAINIYSRVIKAKPDYVFAYYQRGVCYLKSNDMDNAINDLYTAGTYEPTLKKECFTILSNIFKQKGDNEKAKQFLEDALK